MPPLNRLLHLVAGGILCLAALARAQEALSLPECLQLAFKSSNLLRIAGLTTAAGEERVAQLRGSRLPALTAKSSYLRIGKVSSFSIPMGGRVMDFRFGTPNRLNADLGLNVPLYTWGRLSGQIEAARTGVEISRSDQRQKALEVTDQVLRAWYATLLAQKAIAAAELQLQRAEKNLAITRTRQSSGHASRLEALRAEVQAANARALLDENRLNLQKAALWLAKVVGRTEASVTAAGALAFAPLRLNADSLIQASLARRQELITLGLQKELLRQQIDVTSRATSPALNGVAAWSLQNGFNPMAPDDFVDNWNVGLQLSFPLFDGGVTRHKVRESEKQLEALHWQDRELRDLAVVQIRQALLSLEQSEQKYRAQEANSELARQALASAGEQYQQGVLSSLDLIAAQQALAESELLALRALHAHTLARLDLCKASGDYSLSGAAPANLNP